MKAEKNDESNESRTLLLSKSNLSKRLTTASYFGNLNKVNHLLSDGADPNSRADFEQEPAICRAVGSQSKNSAAIVKSLVDAKANVNARTHFDHKQGDYSGVTALHLSVQSGQIVQVKLLIEIKADPLLIAYEQNACQFALSQFIYYRTSLHIDNKECQPSTYGLKTSPATITCFGYDSHDDASTKYGQVAWFLLFKFPRAFSCQEKKYLLAPTQSCKTCTKLYDEAIAVVEK